MKLKNKETGEIVEITTPITNGDGWNIKASSLAELCKEWEDYEEPKGFWVIEEEGSTQYITNDMLYADYVNGDDFMACCKQIGNHFETKEEAEKAVKKLKALKRLKEKKFRFDGYDITHDSKGNLYGKLFCKAGDYCIEDIAQDLDLLFSGVENERDELLEKVKELEG